MFDTTLVVVGNVLVAPEWRRVPSSGALVANFKIASTSRRYDRENKCWIDGNNLRIRVTAWRRLAEGVASSVTVGDPIIVCGRVYTRDWTDEQGNNRVTFEMEAFSIGHDLARGRARFFRGRSMQEAGTVEDREEEGFVAGEMTIPLGAGETPITYGDGLPADAEPSFAEVVAGLEEIGEPSAEDPATESESSGNEPPAGPRRSRRSARKEPVAA